MVPTNPAPPHCQRRGKVGWDLDRARRVVGPDAVSRTGFTARLDLKDLPPDTRIFYRVSFENLDALAVAVFDRCLKHTTGALLQALAEAGP